MVLRSGHVLRTPDPVVVPRPPSRLPPALDDAGFEAALRGVWPSLGAYALSFAVLAGFWRDQRWIVQQVRQCDTLMVRIALLHLALFLLARRRPHRPGDPLSSRATCDGVIELASVVPVAAASVIVAFSVSPSAALWTRLAVLPLKYLLRLFTSARDRT
ncbi:TMEM175 family protein [Streptomyces sp. H34-S4]|nr:TMEM175 family protein [Streptomyces sp. H34-S4]